MLKKVKLTLSKLYGKCKKYVYVQNRYSIKFISNVQKGREFKTKANKIIYCFWTGNNEMSKNRAIAIANIEKNAGVPVILVSPKNLTKFILNEHPLHPAYQYLSNVHKSDYLRCYFMHHHGGGYSDVKSHFKSWNNAFDNLNRDNTKICVGYPELRKSDIGYVVNFCDKADSELVNKDMKSYYFNLIGNGSYIFKPGTVFTQIWLNELHRRLDLSLPDLRKHPGNIMGDNEGYPLKWTSILGQIFHPLSLIFQDEILRDKNLRPDMKDYR